MIHIMLKNKYSRKLESLDNVATAQAYSRDGLPINPQAVLVQKFSNGMDAEMAGGATSAAAAAQRVGAALSADADFKGTGNRRRMCARVASIRRPYSHFLFPSSRSLFQFLILSLSFSLSLFSLSLSSLLSLSLSLSPWTTSSLSDE